MFRLFSSGLFGLFLFVARFARRGFLGASSGLSAACVSAGVSSVSFVFAEARFARLGRLGVSAFGSSGDVSVCLCRSLCIDGFRFRGPFGCRSWRFNRGRGILWFFWGLYFVSATASTVPSSFLRRASPGVDVSV